MLLVLSSVLVVSSAIAATLEECKDDFFFVQNIDACVPLIAGEQAAASTTTEFTPAVSDAEVTDRSADLSGCGLHRDCMRCANDMVHNCQWNPGTGCVRRFNNNPSVCTPANNVAPKCSVIPDCQSCTNQNGCVFFQGKCTYSAGPGCQSDPQNCINYSWQCPAPFVTQQVVVAPPAAVQYDRVAEIVAEVDAMTVGMGVQDLKRLRAQLDSMLLQKEQYAAPYASRYAPLYSPRTAPAATPAVVSNPWVTTFSTSAATPTYATTPMTYATTPTTYATTPTATAYPPAYTTSAYNVNSLGYVNSFTNTAQSTPAFSTWQSTPTYSYLSSGR